MLIKLEILQREVKMGFESSKDLFTDCSILKQFSVQFGKERTVYILEFLNMILFEGVSSR